MARFGTKFESIHQDWETPDELFGKLNDEFHFTLDVCATPENAKCPQFFTKADNALAKEWRGVCWMNPPFGEQGKWVRKAYQSAQSGATVICLLPSRTNTNWWHDYCMKGEIRFVRGRPKFKGAEHGLPQPLAIVVFTPPSNNGLQLTHFASFVCNGSPPVRWLMLEMDFSYCGLPRARVVEWAVLPSGRIVAMTEQESFWFEPDGQSPKGSYLVPWPPPNAQRPADGGDSDKFESYD